MGINFSSEKQVKGFSIVWLDAQVNSTDENRQVQKCLRNLVCQLTVFDRENECRTYIESLSIEQKILLIISGQLGQIFVPQIHQLQQIFSIYVYCRNKQLNEQWSKSYPKIKTVVIHLSDLMKSIEQEQDKQIRLEEPFAFQIYSMHNQPDRSTTKLNGQFVHSILLIDVLLRMKTKQTDDRKELLDLCYKYCPEQHSKIQQFETNYSPKKALWWYTYESFLYEILNQALRIQSIEVMYAFRFIIQDIYYKLLKHQCQQPVHVYRGQVMSKEEILVLQQSKNNLISNNSFFSTSQNRQKAMDFLNKKTLTNQSCRVLFEIDANPCVMSSKPFADISQYSAYRNEQEILFMIGCVFRLIDIHQDDEQYWIVRMNLCRDDEHDMKILFDNMKRDYAGGNNQVDHLAFGRVLRRMGKYDLAEKFYRRLLHQIPSNHPSLADLYYSLGVVIMDIGDYQSSCQWFYKSLEIIYHRNPFDYTNIANRYCCLGTLYWKQGNYETALIWNRKGIELIDKIDRLLIAHFYNNMTLVSIEQEKYFDALENAKTALNIYEKYLPNDHPDMGSIYDNIGLIYRCLGHFNLALDYHKQSLEIRKKSLPWNHSLIALTYRHIGLVYEQIRQLNEALIYLQQSLNIYLQSLQIHHPDVQKLDQDIKRICIRYSD